MQKIPAPDMVYIQGEEMTRYCMSLVLEQWISPYIDTSRWQFFDLSAKHRDATKDKVLSDAVNAGKRVKAIFKEPTMTPTNDQAQAMGLSKSWGSPNGAMRRGWNGISISRDTIMIPGIELGYKNPVLFDRHAVGGEYGASHASVGKGKVITTFYPDDETNPPSIVSARVLTNEQSALVTYDNPLDNVYDLAHHFFSRSLAANVTPHVSTKKTVFKWQEPFWQIMKEVFDTHYKQQFADKGLLAHTNGELSHIISDAAAMKLPQWLDGNFSMVAHNYDGDMLTDLMSAVHQSPGFISSALVGKAEDGSLIKEFEASHGTVADMYHDHQAGKETSLNPLGMVNALIEAMNYSAELSGDGQAIYDFTASLRSAMYAAMQAGQATRDMLGVKGLTTEQFIEVIQQKLAAR